MLIDTVAQPLPVVVTYSKVRVTVVQGPDKGTTHELVADTLTVGTSPESGLVLSDATVSRHHCAISPVEGGVRVRDEGSRNGVFFGGMRVYDVVLTSATQVQLGNTVLHIEPLTELVSREQAVVERYGDLLGRSARMRELFADLL